MKTLKIMVAAIFLAAMFVVTVPQASAQGQMPVGQLVGWWGYAGGNFRFFYGVQNADGSSWGRSSSVIPAGFSGIIMPTPAGDALHAMLRRRADAAKHANEEAAASRAPKPGTVIFSGHATGEIKNGMVVLAPN